MVIWIISINTKYILGETIILYQFMENDLKLIYAGMLSGNFYKNIDKVRSTYKGLGQIVDEENCVSLEDQDNNTIAQNESVKKLLDSGMSWGEMWMTFGQKEYLYDENLWQFLIMQ